ncbi:MAG: UDP-N-acetylmuramoyl-L-alanine--D-glutamate ligase [Christensenellales bacterium]|jgi:UDP-N-acetylmuramoylalanine--D-glutamate ligase
MKRRALVIGMAKSGVASAKLLHDCGFEVVVNDRRERQELGEEIDALLPLGLTWRLCEPPETLLDGVDLLVVSPGVPQDSRGVVEARRRGIEVIGEIELGYRYAKGDFVCITGTNGKTTTTALTGQIFLDAGRRTFVVGNIGRPIAQEALHTRDGDIVVAEVAGFQLESTVFFHPKVAVFTNITEDHLDRFGTMEAYIASKLNIFKNQGKEDFAVLNYDDGTVREFSSKTAARVVYFSRKEALDEGVFMENGRMVCILGGVRQEICEVGEIGIPGAHNLENALAAAAAALVMGICPDCIRKTLREFPGVEHRIELVAEIDGVYFINDSKGTNPDSTRKAIDSMERPTVLILGGYDKKNNFRPLFEAFTENIYHVVAVGATKDAILAAAKETGFLSVSTADTFQGAIEQAFELAQPGCNVLLSPACASYDMFRNFEERGAAFKRIVRDLRR